MKVIFVIVSMAGGGAERVISILANRFIKKGIDVSIVMTAGDAVAYELDPKVELFCAGGTTGGSMLKRLQRIGNMRRFFKQSKDSVIISFGPGTSFFAVLADMFLKHPFVISERNDPAACPHPKLRNLVYRRGDRIVYQTQEAMKCFPQALQKKGCVIPNPLKEGLPKAYTGEREKTIVAVGRLEKQKNYALLIEAFAAFHQKYPEYTLHIYGKGSLQEELEKQAKKLSISENIVWEGFQTDVLSKIEKAGMYVISSDYEGISNAMLEAMAIGLPVVATDCPIGGAAMCIQNGINGLLVPCKDKDALTDALLKLADNQKLADQIGIEATKVRENFAEETISNLWIEQIEKALKK